MRIFLFLLVILLPLISRIIGYADASWTIEDGAMSMVGTTNSVTAGLKLLSLTICLYLSFTIKNFNRYWSVVKTPATVLIILVIFWTLHTLYSIGFVETLYASTSPFVYLTVLALLLGCDDDFWKLLKKISPIMALINIALCYSDYNVVVVLMQANLSGNTPVTVYLVLAIWWLAVCVVDFQKYKIWNRVLVYSMIIACGLIAFSLTYRSWIIQSILLLIVASMQFGQGMRTKIVTRFVILAGIVATIYYIAGSYSWEGEVDRLITKSENDTRWFQYTEIFEQVDMLTWIFGGGINASYKSALYGEGYRYIDNQFLFTAFHYGIVVILMWFILWCKLLIMYWKSKCNSATEMSYVYICILWLLALGGLSVYNVIIIDEKNIILPIILGRCLVYSLRSNRCLQ